MTQGPERVWRYSSAPHSVYGRSRRQSERETERERWGKGNELGCKKERERIREREG